ncbi:MAG: FAD-binding oxidoreductase [Roseiflexaceae bacterium]|nr:FAD-binding oxidoreductase [Roseiflexus sp.]MDW8212528.1 FAD-binding oxidoreductase [Roseiflexaceae bacterium]
MSRATVIIVGGGVTGLSAAYHLARRRFGRVIVLDKGPVGDGSSSRAAGIITGLLWSEPGVLARKKALALYRELSEELDGYRFQDVGCLNLFDPLSWPERERLLPLYERLGAPFEILDAPEMRRRWPALHLPDDIIGLYDPLGGYSEPHEYIPALVQRLHQLGVEIREGVQVEGLLERGGRVYGVWTASGPIESDAVVCTVYAWTNVLLRSVGVQLPVKSFVHQRYVTRPLAAPVAIPAINANPYGGYIRPAHGGRLLAGMETADREEYRVSDAAFHMSALSAPAGIADEMHRRFSNLVPALATTTWESEKVGLLTFASDGEPILGPVSRLPGLFVGVAFHSGGFAYNPVTGMLLAEYVADGRTSIDVSAFSPDRFDPADVEAYLAKTVTQRDVVRRRH